MCVFVSLECRQASQWCGSAIGESCLIKHHVCVRVCSFLILLPAQSFDTEDSGDISRLGTDSETDGWHLQDLEGKASTVSDVMHNLACMFLLSTVCLHDCDHCLITVSLHYHYYFIILSSFRTLQYGDYAAAYSLSPRTQEEEHRPYMLGTPLDLHCTALLLTVFVLASQSMLLFYLTAVDVQAQYHQRRGKWNWLTRANRQVRENPGSGDFTTSMRPLK
jgi:hypothetical protein